MLSHACIEFVNKDNLIEKWDWYGQTACLAAAAQDPAREGRSQDRRKCRNLTRNSINCKARTHNSKRTSKQQTIFMKFIPKVVNSFIKI